MSDINNHIFRAICVRTDDWVYGKYHEVGGIYYMVGYDNPEYCFSSNDRRYREKIHQRVYQIIPTTIGMYSGAFFVSDHPMFIERTYVFEGDVVREGNDRCKFTVTYNRFNWICVGDDGDGYGAFTLSMSELCDRKRNFTMDGNIHQQNKTRKELS
jgi:hypothetical protein